MYMDILDSQVEEELVSKQTDLETGTLLREILV